MQVCFESCATQQPRPARRTRTRTRHEHAGPWNFANKGINFRYCIGKLKNVQDNLSSCQRTGSPDGQGRVQQMAIGRLGSHRCCHDGQMSDCLATIMSKYYLEENGGWGVGRWGWICFREIRRVTNESRGRVSNWRIASSKYNIISWVRRAR